MSVAAPAFLLLGAGLALLVVALHLLARRRPRPRVFPTARFVPDRPARAPALSRRPTDPLLLALRALAVLLLAAAFARPAPGPRQRTALVVLVDRSRAVRSPVEVRDSAAALAGDVVVAFDSSARVVAGAAGLDTTVSPSRGSLSTALIVAAREAARFGRAADSVELAIVSPFVEEEWDAATSEIRRGWPGRIRLVRVAAAVEPPTGVALAITDDDPVGAAASLAGLRADTGGVRLVRGAPSAVDSAWAREGGALVAWRVAAPPSWPAGPGDTVGAVVAGEAVVVARFARAALPPPGLAVAHWVDGVPAATEMTVGGGCIRNVAVPIATHGDLALRESARRLVRALAGPCGGYRRLAAVPDSVLALLAGEGPLARASAFARSEARVPASPWLLVAALALLVVEQLVRRRPRATP